MNTSRTNFPLLVLVLAIAAVLFAVGWFRIDIDTDIVASLPQDDPVIRDAVRIFENHPFQDQLTIDVALRQDDPDSLVICGQAVAEALQASSLFKKVGMTDMTAGLPQLMQQVLSNLPVLFTEDQLNEAVAPLLRPEAVVQRVSQLQSDLLQMDAIGQAATIARDPLGMKDLVMAKLVRLAPTTDARMYKGQLISKDGKHLLVVATPVASGTDTAFAKQLATELRRITVQIEQQMADRGIEATLTPVGAYRAALDNETIVRSDVSHAILFSSIGIALLLMVAFPRPLIGLLSMLPAVVGTLTAFFVFSLLKPGMSVLVLGFGGAIISITVDHGIAYLLFLDRPQRSFGKQASRDVWAVGLLAALTTIGAFGALLSSDFPVLQQLGLFTALGICFSFLFVHTIFPKIFPTLKAARNRRLPLQEMADRLFAAGDKGFLAALALFIALLFFAAPGFNLNLSDMNTVSDETRAAEKQLSDAWGDIFSKVFVMTEGESVTTLQQKSDQLMAALEAASADQLLDQTFLTSMVSPGAERRKHNLAAWQTFWNPGRIEALQQHLTTAGVRAGFRQDAFTPFYRKLNDPVATLGDGRIPPAVYPLLGISRNPASDQWRQFSTLTLPPGVSGDDLYTAIGSLAHLFDPQLFSERLGNLMAHTFVRLLWIVGTAVVLLLLIFFLDIKLTLTALAPVVFAMVCTLGTLNLMGRSLDIPGLILAVVILGMGIDYSLFMVRAYQRYGRADDPSFRLIRSAVLMTAASTLIGFGVLANAGHALLNSAGVTATLGIGYSALGVFLLLPPLLKRQFEGAAKALPSDADLPTRVSARYRYMETFIRQFARFKMKLDTLFGELSERVTFQSEPRILADIGTGYGVPACWLAESYPGVKIYGIEPEEDRVRVANRALGPRGEITCGAAPTLPTMPDGLDGAFVLDMMHYLSDDHLMHTLQGLFQKMAHDAPLFMRCVMAPQSSGAFTGCFDTLGKKFGGAQTYFRSERQIVALIDQAGFDVRKTSTAGRKGDMLWVHAARR